MTKMSRELRYIQLIAVIVVAILYMGMKSMPFPRPASEKFDNYYVERVVDGDTLKLSNGQKIRLIGIDTPELHYSEKLMRDAKRSHRDIETIQALGKKAYDFTKALCAHKKVRLEYDATKKDRYGRILAYVYLEDGTFVNAKIVGDGYAQVMTIPPNVKYADYFLKLQQEARNARRGLWGITDNL
jgi:micrococcal nuclease